MRRSEARHEYTPLRPPSTGLGSRVYACQTPYLCAKPRIYVQDRLLSKAVTRALSRNWSHPGPAPGTLRPCRCTTSHAPVIVVSGPGGVGNVVGGPPCLAAASRHPERATLASRSVHEIDCPSAWPSPEPSGTRRQPRSGRPAAVRREPEAVSPIRLRRRNRRPSSSSTGSTDSPRACVAAVDRRAITGLTADPTCVGREQWLQRAALAARIRAFRPYPRPSRPSIGRRPARRLNPVGRHRGRRGFRLCMDSGATPSTN